MALARITVLISGRGSNLGALLAAQDQGAFAGAVTHVISNRADAGGLALARDHGIATTIVEHGRYADRREFDAALQAAVDAGEPDLVVLAGFMRVLGAAFVQRYEGRLLNIHPSLLPSYPGLHTHRRALADGARSHGCTVHFVAPDVDAGPIVAQARVDVLPGDDEASLAARVLEAEHRLLPQVVGWFCAGRVVIARGQVHVKGDSGTATAAPNSAAAPN